LIKELLNIQRDPIIGPGDGKRERLMNSDGPVVGLWLISLDSAGSGISWAMARLAPEERALAERFPDHTNTVRFAVTRAALRQLLGEYTNRSCADIRLTYGEAGKPYLNSDTSVYFNVSHSADLAVIAMSTDTPVGVDVEQRRELELRVREMVTELFHPEEEERLTALPDETMATAVLRCWTMKEAVGKAVGFGLDDLLERVVVDADPAKPPRLLRLSGDQAPERWSLRQMSVVPYRALMTLAAPVPNVRVESVRCYSPPSFAD
jgi:4'-phosphopantetheinyl transferase